jgi:hypothetical protein
MLVVKVEIKVALKLPGLLIDMEMGDPMRFCLGTVKRAVAV